MRRRRRPGGGVVGAAAFVANAVAFDGSADRLNASTVALAASKTATISIWFRWLNTTGFTVDTLVGYKTLGSESGVGVQMFADVSATTFSLTLLGYNGAESSILIVGTGIGDFTLDQEWHHFAASVDMADVDQLQVYYDGVDVTDEFDTVSAFVDDEIEYPNAWSVGALASGLFFGDMGPVVVSNTYTDLSDPANLALFIADGAPVQPVYDDWPIVLDGPTDTWHVNKGTLGDIFTEVGALTDGQTPVELGS